MLAAPAAAVETTTDITTKSETVVLTPNEFLGRNGTLPVYNISETEDWYFDNIDLTTYTLSLANGLYYNSSEIAVPLLSRRLYVNDVDIAVMDPDGLNITARFDETCINRTIQGWLVLGEHEKTIMSFSNETAGAGGIFFDIFWTEWPTVRFQATNLTGVNYVDLTLSNPTQNLHWAIKTNATGFDAYIYDFGVGWLHNQSDNTWKGELNNFRSIELREAYFALPRPDYWSCNLMNLWVDPEWEIDAVHALNFTDADWTQIFPYNGVDGTTVAEDYIKIMDYSPTTYHYVESDVMHLPNLGLNESFALAFTIQTMDSSKYHRFETMGPSGSKILYSLALDALYSHVPTIKICDLPVADSDYRILIVAYNQSYTDLYLNGTYQITTVCPTAGEYRYLRFKSQIADTGYEYTVKDIRLWHSADALEIVEMPCTTAILNGNFEAPFPSFVGMQAAYITETELTVEFNEIELDLNYTIVQAENGSMIIEGGAGVNASQFLFESIINQDLTIDYTISINSFVFPTMLNASSYEIDLAFEFDWYVYYTPDATLLSTILPWLTPIVLLLVFPYVLSQKFGKVGGMVGLLIAVIVFVIDGTIDWWIALLMLGAGILALSFMSRKKQEEP